MQHFIHDSSGISHLFTAFISRCVRYGGQEQYLSASSQRDGTTSTEQSSVNSTTAYCLDWLTATEVWRNQILKKNQETKIHTQMYLQYICSHHMINIH